MTTLLRAVLWVAVIAGLLLSNVGVVLDSPTTSLVGLGIWIVALVAVGCHAALSWCMRREVVTTGLDEPLNDQA